MTLTSNTTITLTTIIQEPISSSYKDKILNINLEESVAYKYIWDIFLEYKTHGNIPTYTIRYPNPYTGEYLSSINYNGYTFPKDFILHVSKIFVNTYPNS